MACLKENVTQARVNSAFVGDYVKRYNLICNTVWIICVYENVQKKKNKYLF